MQLRPSSVRAPALLLGACGVALVGCPQLLEDDFDVNPALPATNLNSGGLASDAGDPAEEAGGASGAGGASTAGSGSTLGGAAGSGLPPTASSGSGGSAGASSGTPDAGSPPSFVTELGPLLAHRYGFAAAGATVIDGVGTADGTVVGTTVSAGSDKVSLSGDEQFVNLPNGLISGLESVTIEAWVNWLAEPSSSDAEWQNVFDFGSSGTEGAQGFATTRVYLTAKSVSGYVRAGYAVTDFDHEISAEGARALPVSADPTRGTQVVLVVDGASDSLTIYIDGNKEDTTSDGAIDLSLIEDINDWIGRSQYDSDPEFEGEILDFRIYSAPLSDAQVALSFSLGPGANL